MGRGQPVPEFATSFGGSGGSIKIEKQNLGAVLRNGLPESYFAKTTMLFVLLFAPSGANAAAGAGSAFLGQSIGAAVASISVEGCHGDAEPDAATVAMLRAEAANVMKAYFDLTPASNRTAIAHVFARSQNEVHWRDESGPVQIDQLGERLGAHAGPLALTNARVAGDFQSIREQWTVTPSGADAAPIMYSVDFVFQSSLFDPLKGMRILHMTVTPASLAPSAPVGYCHLDYEHGY